MLDIQSVMFEPGICTIMVFVCSLSAVKYFCCWCVIMQKKLHVHLGFFFTVFSDLLS